MFNTLVINGLPAVSCYMSICKVDWKFEKVDEILCKHGYNIKNCPSNLLYYNKVSSEFMKIYNSLLILDNKVKMIKFLLYDNYTKAKPIVNNINDLLNIKDTLYDANIWNMLCKYIKVDIKIFDYLHYYSNPTKNQIYKIIQIGKDLTINEKLYLYSNAETIELLDKSKFIKENINNLDYFQSSKCFEITTETKTDDNKKYTTEIFNTKLLKQVKEIREKVFGEAENDIDITMIPIAYEKYGLFWKPIPYSNTN